MHLMYTNQIIYCMCLERMSANRSAAKVAYTLKKKSNWMLLLVLSVFTSLPTGYGKSLCYACLMFHVEPHLLAPPEVVIIAFQQNKSAYSMAPDPSSSC